MIYNCHVNNAFFIIIIIYFQYKDVYGKIHEGRCNLPVIKSNFLYENWVWKSMNIIFLRKWHMHFKIEYFCFSTSLIVIALL